MDELLKNFTNSLQTGYVDKTILSNIDYQPELLVNQKNPPKKVLSKILQEFENCSQFFISVAFVTTSGVAVIINKLKELEDRKIKGKILVSQYLNFTEPEALKKLMQFKNIELRIATTGNAGPTKGDSDAEIGTVFIAIATPKEVIVEEFNFGQPREKVIDRAVNKAFEMIRKEIFKNLL